MKKESKSPDYNKVNQDINERLRKFNNKSVDKSSNSTVTKTKTNEKERE